MQQVKKVFNSSLDKKGRSESLSELNKNLNLLGFGNSLVPAKIGFFTRNKIKAFQTAYNLPVTGMVNIETLLKVDELLSTSIKIDESHNHLPLLKGCLNLLGYGPLSLTKIYEEQTQLAVKKIQKIHNLPVNGLIDERTKYTIYEAVTIAVKREQGLYKRVVD